MIVVVNRCWRHREFSFDEFEEIQSVLRSEVDQ